MRSTRASAGRRPQVRRRSPEVTSEPMTAVPTVEPRDRMNCVAEVATPRRLFSTVL